MMYDDCSDLSNKSTDYKPTTLTQNYRQGSGKK